jgi:hypothetical protein
MIAALTVGIKTWSEGIACFESYAARVLKILQNHARKCTSGHSGKVKNPVNRPD